MRAKTPKLKFIDFCAGIGGGRLGLERGMNAVCVGFSEIMKASEKLIDNYIKQTMRRILAI